MFFNDFIPALLKMSITAGIAVIFVLLLRLLLKKGTKSDILCTLGSCSFQTALSCFS